jgi:hypothetical protein
MKTQTKTNGTIRIHKSLDPTWPYYGVAGIYHTTQWFKLKADAERFAATGICKGALALQTIKP